MNWKTFVKWAAHAQLLPVLENGENAEEILVGGQAVMEGVMMRAPHSYCVAVRRPDGSYATEEAQLDKLSDRYPLFKYPLVRGVGILGYSLYLGMKALRFSANVMLEAELAKEAAERGETLEQRKQSGEMPGWVMAVQILFTLGFFLLMYKFIPLLIATYVQRHVPALSGWMAFNLVDGVVRLVIFIGFLWILAMSKEIHRVFEYHGAEHRVVFNFESGKPLTVANAQSFRTFHPRCGTSFLLVVMLVSIAVYALIPTQSFALRFATRVVALPLIMGLSYEIIRFASKHKGSLLALITAPGLWLQRITTQPPSDDQTEVAIRALEGAMEIEQRVGGKMVIA